MTERAVRYPVRTRILHWLTAILVFAMLLIGFHHGELDRLIRVGWSVRT